MSSMNRVYSGMPEPPRQPEGEIVPFMNAQLLITDECPAGVQQLTYHNGHQESIPMPPPADDAIPYIPTNELKPRWIDGSTGWGDEIPTRSVDIPISLLNDLIFTGKLDPSALGSALSSDGDELPIIMPAVKSAQQSKPSVIDIPLEENLPATNSDTSEKLRTTIKDSIRDALILGVMGMPEGDSPVEVIKTDLWRMGQTIKEKGPETIGAFRNIGSGMSDSTRRAVMRVAVPAAVAGVAAVALITPNPEAGQPSETKTEAASNVSLPKPVLVSYLVPKNQPRVRDIATALDLSPEDVAEQLTDQVGELTADSRIEAGLTLNLKAKGVNYRPNATDTVESLGKRFHTGSNMIRGANPELFDLEPGEPVSKTIENVVIPRPVGILQMPEDASVEDISALPEVAKVLEGFSGTLADLDPGFDGSSLVIPEELVPAVDTTPNSTVPEETTTSVDEPSTTQLVEKNSTTTIAAPVESTTTVPAAIETPAPAPASPEIAQLNAAMDTVSVMSKNNDISNVVFAAIAADKAFAPNDPDRRADLPSGYVKMLLPHEAPGMKYLGTVAERTHPLERYTAPPTAAVRFAIQVGLQQFIDGKYPQYAGVVDRIRDANSPFHGTHFNGQMFDFNTHSSLNIDMYSDGPVGDYQFSPNYDPEFNYDMAMFVGGLTVGGQRAVKRIITSDAKLAARVNADLGYRLMGLDNSGEHKDHWHFIMNPAFNLENWHLRAKDFPWSTDQDLRIAGMAKPISPEQRAAAHAPYDQWLGRELTRLEKAQIETVLQNSTTTVAPAANPQKSTTTTTATTSTTAAPPTTAPVLEAAPNGIEKLPESTRNFMFTQLQKVEALKHVYQEVERQTGVPWQLMAAIHYREANNGPNQSMMAGEEIGSVNPDQGIVVGTDLVSNGVQTAKHFRDMARMVYGVEVDMDMTPDEMTKALLANHRGFLYKRANVNPLNSPYISNGLPGAEKMKFPHSGEVASTRGRTDGRPGALAMLIALNYIDF